MEGREVTVKIAKRFKITVENKSMHWGCHYIEDEWNIVVYAPTIEELTKEIRKRMIDRLINVWSWELEECEVILYKNNLYEIEEETKDITKDYPTFISDITSEDSYKEEFAKEKEECNKRLKASRYSLAKKVTKIVMKKVDEEEK